MSLEKTYSTTSTTRPLLDSAFPLDVKLSALPAREDKDTRAADTLLALAHQWDSDTTAASEARPSSPKTLSDIAGESTDDGTDDNDDNGGESAFEGGECGFCSAPLGSMAAAPSRIFRCSSCQADILCASCCYDMHVCNQSHILEEYLVEEKVWTSSSLQRTGLHMHFTMNCGSCGTVVAAAGKREPDIGTLACPECKDSLRCQDCCILDHAASPLHGVRMWNGRYWERFSLRDIGFVYNMGHEGRVCRSPEAVSTLIVITLHGLVKIAVKYCRCGKFVDGLEGRREQIEYTGWYPSLLEHDGMCSTFRVRGEHGRIMHLV
ncbi:hypothetical protein C8R46DRAFT_1238477 [Mycena filopes]|nr:hypothetical protein C8R46DRAFT_1238477 [Mycena filopes]